MEFTYKQWKCRINVKKYINNNRIALSLSDAEDGGLIAYITSNVPEIDLDQYEIVVKNYSENLGMDVWLIANGLATCEGEYVKCGHVTMPIMRLSEYGRRILNV